MNLLITGGSRGLGRSLVLDGGMGRETATIGASEKMQQFWRQSCPVRREGQFAEIAGLVAYLASKEASFVNRQAISLTGGMDWIP
jgi:3-oxoacyl-[acyl-carrier protein] reductase